MLRSISKTIIVLGLLFSGANAQMIDDDFYQHAIIDSTIDVDSGFHLWVFLDGPYDTGFNAVEEVSQNQQFVLTLGDSSYFLGDTLYIRPHFPYIGASAISVIWTNSYDDGMIISSGPITQLIMKVKVHTVPGDSILDNSFWADSTVISRHSDSLKDSSWAITLGSGGQPDRATVVGLDSTKEYWLAIKIGDEAYNWSEVSNNVLKTAGDYLDSTTTQVYKLVTSWNKWYSDLQEWKTGPAGPVTIIEVTLGVVPSGEAITVSVDGP